MVISDSTPPAERARKSQLRSDTSERSAAKHARTVASMRSRASRVGTRAGLSHARTETRVPPRRLGRLPGRVDGNLLGHGVHAGDALGRARQRHRADARDVAAVAADLAPRGEHVVALHVGRERAHPHLLGQGVHALVVRADETPTHVDRHTAARGLGPHPSADPVPGLEDDDRPPRLGQPPRRREPGQTRAPPRRRPPPSVRVCSHSWSPCATSSAWAKLTCVPPACK